MKKEKKIEIINRQITRLDATDFNFRTWLDETKNLIDKVFIEASIKKHQLQSVLNNPLFMLAGVNVKTASTEWKKLLESYLYEIDLEEEELEPKLALIPKEFIHNDRITQLRNCENSKFDLSKLIKLCEELNSNFTNSNYFSVAMICRSILDHVPPIFEHKTFNEVANNYGGKSLKKTFGQLNITMRSIADMYLHDTIKSKESIPNEIQVDFKSEFDILIAEIIRICD